MAYSMKEEKEFYTELTLANEWDFTGDDMGKDTVETKDVGGERPGSRIEGFPG